MPRINLRAEHKWWRSFRIAVTTSHFYFRLRKEYFLTWDFIGQLESFPTLIISKNISFKSFKIDNGICPSCRPTSRTFTETSLNKNARFNVSGHMVLRKK